MRRGKVLRVDRFLGSSQRCEDEDARWPLYYWNLLAAALHLAQFVAVHDLALTRENSNRDDVPFIAGRHELRYANTVVSRNGLNNSCVLGHAAVVLASYDGSWSPLDPRFYDFSNTQIIRYYETGSLRVSTPWMIAAFFLASAVFQCVHGELLRRDPLAPRVLPFVEYSVSSSLCVSVLALNVGIHDAYALTGVFGLFFGMNMLGACAELLMCFAEAATPEERDRFVIVLEDSELWGFYPLDAWILPHSAAWVLFESSWGLVFAQYWVMYHCSEREPPATVLWCVALESAAFAAFGIVQHWALRKRRSLLEEPRTVYFEVFDFLTWLLFGYFLVDGLICAWDAAAAFGRCVYDRTHACLRPVLWAAYAAVWVVDAFVGVCKGMRGCLTRRDVLWYMDAWMIGLSLFAKTTLAWLLLGPTIL